MDGMDPTMVILSDPSYEEETEQEESPEYLRGRLEAAEQAAQQRDIELARHQQALQAVLLQQQEMARQQQAQQSMPRLRWSPAPPPVQFPAPQGSPRAASCAARPGCPPAAFAPAGGSVRGGGRGGPFWMLEEHHCKATRCMQHKL